MGASTVDRERSKPGRPARDRVKFVAMIRREQYDRLCVEADRRDISQATVLREALDKLFAESGG